MKMLIQRIKRKNLSKGWSFGGPANFSKKHYFCDLCIPVTDNFDWLWGWHWYKNLSRHLWPCGSITPVQLMVLHQPAITQNNKGIAYFGKEHACLCFWKWEKRNRRYYSFQYCGFFCMCRFAWEFCLFSQIGHRFSTVSNSAVSIQGNHLPNWFSVNACTQIKDILRM